MMNVFIFLIHVTVLSVVTLISLIVGKEAMIACMCIQSVLANLFVIKQVMLFGLQVTTTDAYIISAMLGLNLLQEYYGKSVAQQAVIINIIMLIFYTVASLIQLWYVPAVSDIMHIHFTAILAPVPRVIIASLCSYAVAQMIELRLYGFLKSASRGNYLLIRNYGSLCVSQLVDTVLFSLLGLYGMVDNILHVIFFSYVIKLLVIFFNGPLISVARLFMQRTVSKG